MGTTKELQITFRQDTAAAWELINPILARGEPAYDTTFGIVKVGDGVSSWSHLPVVARRNPDPFYGVHSLASSYDVGSGLNSGTIVFASGSLQFSGFIDTPPTENFIDVHFPASEFPPNSEADNHENGYDWFYVDGRPITTLTGHAVAKVSDIIDGVYTTPRLDFTKSSLFTVTLPSETVPHPVSGSPSWKLRIDFPEDAFSDAYGSGAEEPWVLYELAVMWNAKPPAKFR